MLALYSCRSLRRSTTLRSLTWKASLRTTPITRLPRIGRTSADDYGKDTQEFVAQRMAGNDNHLPSFREELLKDDPKYDMKSFVQEMKKPTVVRQVMVSFAEIEKSDHLLIVPVRPDRHITFLSRCRYSCGGRHRILARHSERHEVGRRLQRGHQESKALYAGQGDCNIYNSFTG